METAKTLVSRAAWIAAGVMTSPAEAIAGPGFSALFLTVNLKTAKALGITFPKSILLCADKVIK